MQNMNDISISTVTQGKKLNYRQTPVLNYQLAYPHVSGGTSPQAAGQINRYHDRVARDFAAHCQRTLLPQAIADYHSSMKNEFPFHPYEADSAFTPTYNQDGKLSLYTDKYEFTGGAHGTTVRTGDTWDTKRGRPLSLAQVLGQRQAPVTKIQAEIVRQIQAQLAAGTNQYFDNYPQLVTQTFQRTQFYLTPEGIAFFFQQYDIAPYSSGIPVFVIPEQALVG